MFSPKSPESWKRNINEWLSSVDILKFMKQYEKAYHCFEFLGPSPIDFDTHVAYGKCVWEDLCNFKLSDTISRGNIISQDHTGLQFLLIAIKKRYITLIVMGIDVLRI